MAYCPSRIPRQQKKQAPKANKKKQRRREDRAAPESVSKTATPVAVPASPGDVMPLAPFPTLRSRRKSVLRRKRSGRPSYNAQPGTSGGNRVRRLTTRPARRAHVFDIDCRRRAALRRACCDATPLPQSATISLVSRAPHTSWSKRVGTSSPSARDQSEGRGVAANRSSASRANVERQLHCRRRGRNRHWRRG